MACLVRLVNEYDMPLSLTFRGAAIATANPAEVSHYAASVCSSATDFAVTLPGPGGTVVALLDGAFPPGDGAVPAYSILAAAGASNASAFPDLTTALPEHPEAVSGAAVRVLGGYGTSTSGGVDVYTVSLNCVACASAYAATLPPGSAWGGGSADWTSFYLPDTEYGVQLDIVPSAFPGGVPAPRLAPGAAVAAGGWTGRLSLQEHAVALLVVHASAPGTPITASLSIDIAGRNQWLPIAYAAAALAAIAILYQVLYTALRRSAPSIPGAHALAAKFHATAGKGGVRGISLLRFFGLDAAIAQGLEEAAPKQERLLAGEDEEEGGTAALAQPSIKPLQGGRVEAIDTLRGLSLCVMAFVNIGAGSYSTLDHSAWDGLHLADLLFPIFVWTSGVSMAISFDAAQRRGATPAALAAKIATRSVKLFLLGLFLNGGAVLAQWRIPGVLQYFAVSNFIVGTAAALLPAAAAVPAPATGDTMYDSLHRDVLRFWKQWVLMLSLLAVYVGLEVGLPLPAGCPKGYLGPGGLANGGAYFGLGCTGGAHRVIDIALFGVNHVYHNTAADGTALTAATCGPTYACDVHDPEGALGWLTAAWMAFLGLQAGRVFVTYKHLHVRTWPYVSRLVGWGLALGLLGGALCGFAKEGGAVPINKNLWSPSFVACLASVAFLFQAALWLLIDSPFRLATGSPFAEVGKNSLAFYVLHETFTQFPFAVYVAYPGYGPSATWYSHAEALASNIVGVAAWVGVARALFLYGIFFNL